MALKFNDESFEALKAIRQKYRSQKEAELPRTLTIDQVGFYDAVHDADRIAIHDEPEKVEVDLSDIIDVAANDARDVVVGTYSHREIEILPSADELITKARTLNEQIGRSYLDLGRVCQTLIAHGVPQEKGYKDLSEFFEKEVQLHYRKASYLIDIAQRVDELGIPDEKMMLIGWSKAKEIVRAADPSVPMLIDNANIMSIEQIKQEVKRSKDLVSDIPEEHRKRRVRLSMGYWDDQLDAIKDAIQMGQEVYGHHDNEALILFKIVTDWTHNQHRAPALETMVTYIEDAYKCKVKLEYNDGN